MGSWIRVHSSVARNPKILSVGPSAAWLWLCSLAYCQDGMTDGFVPRKVLTSLGVATPHRLARRLVAARLWHETDKGWTINDFHEYNQSASARREIWQKRVQSGALGGRARKQSAKANDKQGASPPSYSYSYSSTHSLSDSLSEKATDPPIDQLAQQLLNAYPKQGLCSLHAAAAALADVLHDQPPAAFAALLDRLDAHKRSAKWTEQAGRFIPRLDRYLREGTHLQDMPSADAVAAASGPGARWRPDEEP